MLFRSGPAAQTSVRSVVRQDDGLVLALDIVAVLSREHVHLALIHTELANISLEEEDVRALHARVKDLRSREFVALASTHDLRASQNTRQFVLTRDVQHQRPYISNTKI